MSLDSMRDGEIPEFQMVISNTITPYNLFMLMFGTFKIHFHYVGFPQAATTPIKTGGSRARHHGGAGD